MSRSSRQAKGAVTRIVRPLLSRSHLPACRASPFLCQSPIRDARRYCTAVRTFTGCTLPAPLFAQNAGRFGGIQRARCSFFWMIEKTSCARRESKRSLMLATTCTQTVRIDLAWRSSKQSISQQTDELSWTERFVRFCRCCEAHQHSEQIEFINSSFSHA